MPFTENLCKNYLKMKYATNNPEIPAVPHNPEIAPTEPNRQPSPSKPDIVPEKDPIPAKTPPEVPIRKE